MVSVPPAPARQLDGERGGDDRGGDDRGGGTDDGSKPLPQVDVLGAVTIIIVTIHYWIPVLELP